MNPLRKISEAAAPVLRPWLLRLVCWLINITGDERGPAHYNDGKIWLVDADLSESRRAQLQVQLKHLAEDAAVVLLLANVAAAYYIAGLSENFAAHLGGFVAMALAYVVWIGAREIELPAVRTAEEVDG